MKVGLFVPCYIDQLYPRVAIATLRVLERAGCEVGFPQAQTCCGQPMANAGWARAGLGAMRAFVRAFADGDYDYIVGPSASCVAHVREHFGLLEEDEELTRSDPSLADAVASVRERTWELCQFLTEVLETDALDSLRASFPHRVGLHRGCHGVRMLGLARPSERQAPAFDRVRSLRERVAGLELVELDRPDECCGFGGTFAATEEAVSVVMGRDRVRDHVDHGAEVITSADMSCLMHLEGLIRRQSLPVRVVHVAEILDGSAAEPGPGAAGSTGIPTAEARS